MTRLQRLLHLKAFRDAHIQQHTGRSRTTVFRWRTGRTCPAPDDARKLIELFGADQLDYKGCYEADDQAAA